MDICEYYVFYKKPGGLEDGVHCPESESVHSRVHWLQQHWSPVAVSELSYTTQLSTYQVFSSNYILHYLLN